MSERTRLRRKPERAVDDSAAIRDILDSNFLCFVGYTASHGPVVLPTLYARDGDSVLLHGAVSAQVLRHAKSGNQVCVTVAEVNGIVVARAVFHNSINYRSVVLFGEATEIVDVEEKLAAMATITNHILPGRWNESRRPTSPEFIQTSVLRMPIDEVSAKVRVGPPKDDEPDYALSYWAGVIPVGRAIGEPLRDDRTDVPVPESVKAAVKKWGGHSSA